MNIHPIILSIITSYLLCPFCKRQLINASHNDDDLQCSGINCTVDDLYIFYAEDNEDGHKKHIGISFNLPNKNYIKNDKDKEINIVLDATNELFELYDPWNLIFSYKINFNHIEWTKEYFINKIKTYLIFQ